MLQDVWEDGKEDQEEIEGEQDWLDTRCNIHWTGSTEKRFSLMRWCLEEKKEDVAFTWEKGEEKMMRWRRMMIIMMTMMLCSRRERERKIHWSRIPRADAVMLQLHIRSSVCFVLLKSDHPIFPLTFSFSLFRLFLYQKRWGRKEGERERVKYTRRIVQDWIWR